MIRRFALIIVMIAVVLSSLACGSDDETTGPRITLAPPEKGSAVTFPDPNLEDLIREAFDRPSGDIYESDLKLLQELRANEKGITDLTGLKHCANLKILDLAGNDVEDLTPISNLTSLTDLGLYQNEISDITPLANLTGLNLIVLGENQVSDITPLANLTSLIYLYLADNQISDASPVSNLTNLTHLDLGGNGISDISPISDLTGLNLLHLERNKISDISALPEFTSPTPVILNLGQNKISNISPLVANPGITEASTIVLTGNPLSTESKDAYIPQLEEKNVIIEWDDAS